MIASALLWLVSAGIASEPVLFERPVNLSELNTTCRDKGPYLTCDGLTLYFHSDRAGCGGEQLADIYRASRPSIGGRFGATELVLQNGADPALSCDELTLYFARSVNGPLGPNLDIFEATRLSRSASFGAPQAVASLNTRFDELGPRLTHDGLQLYFSSSRLGTLGALDIWVARRDSPSGTFGAPKNLFELNSPSNDSNAAISHDGLTIYFSSTRPGGLGNADLYKARRRSADTPFDGPKDVLALNSATIDKAPAISGDGLIIVFRSNRDGGAGLSDLYQARDAKSGTVGLGVGAPGDTLFVNGTAGGATRTVTVANGERVTVSLAAPPFGPSPFGYALFAYTRALPGAVHDLPRGIGALAFPAPFASGGGSGSHLFTLCHRFQTPNSSIFGPGMFPAPPAPGEVLVVPQGMPAGLTQLTLQAIVRDDASRSGTLLSVTNAITIRRN